MAEDAKISDSVRLEALEQAVPYAEIQAVVAAHGLQRQRKRKLSAEMELLLGIAMHLYRGCSLVQVLWKLMKGVRLLRPETQPATKGAVSQLRYEIGARPMVDLLSPRMSADGAAGYAGRLLERAALDGDGWHR